THARVNTARRGRWAGPAGQRFAMRQRDVAECRPTSADVGFAIGIEREDPGVALVAESFISEFENGHETFVQERVVEPAVDQAPRRSIAERGQPDLSTLLAVPLEGERHAQVPIDDLFQGGAALGRDVLVKVPAVM